jgi:hypothetical protein
VRRAALARTAVRAAVRDGALGDLPAGLKIGVRSGVDTIAIELDDVPADWTITIEPPSNAPVPLPAGRPPPSASYQLRQPGPGCSLARAGLAVRSSAAGVDGPRCAHGRFLLQ